MALLSTKHGLGRTPNEIERSALDTAVHVASAAQKSGSDPDRLGRRPASCGPRPEELRTKLAADGERYQDLTR